MSRNVLIAGAWRFTTIHYGIFSEITRSMEVRKAIAIYGMTRHIFYIQFCGFIVGNKFEGLSTVSMIRGYSII